MARDPAAFRRINGRETDCPGASTSLFTMAMLRPCGWKICGNWNGIAAGRRQSVLVFKILERRNYDRSGLRLQRIFKSKWIRLDVPHSLCAFDISAKRWPN